MQPIIGFNTQPPEGGWYRCIFQKLFIRGVSTHSRLKAAGALAPVLTHIVLGFNTQPPEGGWLLRQKKKSVIGGFNTQPPEGGWFRRPAVELIFIDVSTHSRLKAAGYQEYLYDRERKFQHTAA